MGQRFGVELLSGVSGVAGQPNIQFKDEGVNAGTSGGVTVVDFVGGGVTASESAGTLTVTIGAGAYSDEQAQDAVGAMVDASLTYVDATPLLQRAALTGDVTAAAGSNATTIANDAVTFAKMQNIATDRLVGRDTAASGDPEELTVGGGLEFSGAGGIQRSALTGDVTAPAGSNSTTIANDAVTDAKLRNSGALSVVGRSANSAGDPADISATAATDAVLRESGSVIGFGTIATGGIANDAVTFAKIQNIATDRLLGRDTAASGDTEELTVGGGLEFTGTGGIQRSALTGDVTASAGSGATTIANDAVTYAKMQNTAAADRLLGRGNGGGAGDLQEITLGTNLSMSGTTLNAAGGSGTWTTLKQTADDSKTNNTLAASTFLTVALSAATQYTIRGVAYILVQDAAADARFDINYSGTWTTVYCHDSRNVAGVAAGTDARTDRMASALPASTDMLATVTGMCIVKFDITGLTNASGTLSFRFAQVTTSATATLLKRGSYMEYMTA